MPSRREKTSSKKSNSSKDHVQDDSNLSTYDFDDNGRTVESHSEEDLDENDEADFETASSQYKQPLTKEAFSSSRPSRPSSSSSSKPFSTSKTRDEPSEIVDSESDSDEPIDNRRGKSLILKRKQLQQQLNSVNKRLKQSSFSDLGVRETMRIVRGLMTDDMDFDFKNSRDHKSNKKPIAKLVDKLSKHQTFADASQKELKQFALKGFSSVKAKQKSKDTPEKARVRSRRNVLSKNMTDFYTSEFQNPENKTPVNTQRRVLQVLNPSLMDDFLETPNHKVLEPEYIRKPYQHRSKVAEHLYKQAFERWSALNKEDHRALAEVKSPSKRGPPQNYPQLIRWALKTNDQTSTTHTFTATLPGASPLSTTSFGSLTGGMDVLSQGHNGGFGSQRYSSPRSGLRSPSESPHESGFVGTPTNSTFSIFN